MSSFVFILSSWYAVKSLIRFVALILDEGIGGQVLTAEGRLYLGANLVASVAISIWGFFLLFT